MSGTNAELRAKLARVAGEMEAILNTCKRQGNRGLNASERDRWEKLVEDHHGIEGAIEASATLDSINRKLASPQGSRVIEDNLEEFQDTFRLSPSDKRMRDRDPHARAFSKFLRGGLSVLDDAERHQMIYIPNTGGSGIRAAQTETTTGGGYVVPTGFSGLLEEAKKWFGGIDGVVGKFITESGNPWPWPTVNDTANKGRIIGINTQVTETDLAFGQVTFNAYIGSSDIVLVPLALMKDAYFDLDALIARLLGTRLGRLYNWKCTVGSGSSEPTGVVTAAVAAGNVVTAGGSTTSGEVTTVKYSDLVNLEGAVDPSYRYNPSSYFMFGDAMLKAIKLLVDSNGRPLWQPGLTASFRQGAAVDLVAAKPTILDHPYIINQDMAVPAASAYSALFGDLSCFKVRELRAGTTVMRLVERYSDYLQVGFMAYQRFDANLIDAGTHPVAVLQQSAS